MRKKTGYSENSNNCRVVQDRAFESDFDKEVKNGMGSRH
jgi:hypothetical protein